MRVHLLRSLLVAALACAAVACNGNSEPTAQAEFLQVEQAFPYTAEADADNVAVRFDVPKGYYLYRANFGFASRNEAITLGTPRLPESESHWDEFNGDQQIYRGAFTIEIPYDRTAAADTLPLTLKLRGCADAGLCYVPQTWRTDVALPAAARAAAGIEVFAQDLLERASSELLPLDEAFTPDARFDGPNELVVSFRIAPDYYLYRKDFAIEVAGGVGAGEAVWPAGVQHRDDNFGDVEVFYNEVTARIPLSRRSPDALPLTIKVNFQGCKERSVCYPPAERTLERVLPAVAEFAAAGVASSGVTGSVAATSGTNASGSAASAAAGGTGATGSGGGVRSEQSRLADVILGGSWLKVLLTFYGAGLLLAFTPCVLPMVPILSSIIIGQGAQASPTRAFALSLSYVLGMAVTYTVAGALAALAGEQVQAIFQKPWILALFAGVFVVLALGMFGAFQLQMPAAIQSRMAALANRQKAGTFAGTAVIGALSALIVTTCVAPPLIATLTVIGENGDVVRGASALFFLSIGMGTPLLIAGASAGTLLPKVGAWMNTVKGAFGVLMLAMAVYLLGRVLPGNVTLALWALLVFMTGVFLGAFEPLAADPTPVRRIRKGVGVLACLYGAILLLGSTLGGDDPLRPLAQVSSGMLGREQERELEFRPIKTVAQLEAALAEARTAAQPVMVDFTADWCATCKELEKHTFPNPVVVAALEPFMLLRADVTENDDDDAALLKYFKALGPPTIAFYDSSGRLQEDFEIVGFKPADEFRDHARRLAAL